MSELDIDNPAHRTFHTNHTGITDLTFHWSPCFATFIKDFNFDRTADFDLILLSIGIWDSCTDLMNSLGTKCKINTAEDIRPLFEKFGKDKRIIVRLQPIAEVTDTGRRFNKTLFQQISNIMRQIIPKERIIDHAAIMEPRTQGSSRIRGDNYYHFGPLGRLAIAETTALFMQNVINKCRLGYKSENYNCPSRL